MAAKETYYIAYAYTSYIAISAAYTPYGAYPYNVAHTPYGFISAAYTPMAHTV